MDTHLITLAQKFKEKTILVVGDVMLDHYIDGDVHRISPEAPVPVVHVKKETKRPGGAANVAAGVRAFSGMARLAGITGDDSARWKLLSLLTELGINSEAVLVDTNRPTTTKTKLIARSQQVIRLDKEVLDEIAAQMVTQLQAKIESAMHQCDAVVISDYGKGTVSKELAQSIIENAQKQEVPVIVDAKPHTIERYKGADCITLNKGEVEQLAEQQFSSEGLQKHLKEMAQKFSSQIVITAGDQGMFFATHDSVAHRPAHTVPLADTSGAGDTITASLALALASDAPLSQAAEIANHAGALSVAQAGVTNPTLTELTNSLNVEISEYLQENIKVKQKVLSGQIHEIQTIVKLITDAYRNGNKILIFGNGGSAADAMHWAAELVGRYKIERKGLPAINLTADSSNLTAIGNDYGYEKVFSRQVEALARPGDVLVGISTSGNSPNVIEAIHVGKEMGCHTVCLLGKDGGKLKQLTDVSVVVPSKNTPRIQETHITIIHIICEILEKKLVQEGFA